MVDRRNPNRTNIGARETGASLISILIAVAIGGIVVAAVHQLLARTQEIGRVYDAKATRDDATLYYKKLMEDPRIRKATEAANPELASYMKLGTGYPAVAQGPLEIVNEDGRTLLPREGKYLAFDGSPGRSDRYFWFVQASWQGRAGKTYEYSVNVTKNPAAPIWGNTIKDKVNSSLNPTELVCITVTGTPVLGHQTTKFWDPIIGYEVWNSSNHGSQSRPTDSRYAVGQVTCPEGTRITGMRALSTCGAMLSHGYTLAHRRSIPADLRDRVGECRHFTGSSTDSNCTPWLGFNGWTPTDVWGVRCEATCCTFPE